MKTEELISAFNDGGLNIKKIGENRFIFHHWVNYSFPTLLKRPICKFHYRTLRWKYPVSVILTDCRIKNTYEFILSTSNYHIEQFERKIRNRIRKSLQNCVFMRPSLEDLIQYGLKINQDTCKRQRRKDKMLTKPKYWKKYISSIYSSDDFVILGAYFAGHLVGYVISYELEEEKHIILHAFIDRKDAEITSPMNGLIFTLVNYLIEKKGYITISYGLESFIPLPELNRFKMNMLFRRVPVSRVYLINPFLLFFLKSIIYVYFHLLKHKNSRSAFMRNVIRLYQGYRVLTKSNTQGELAFNY